MSKLQAIRLERKQELHKKATELYKQGLTLRQVGAALKISHEWARQAIEGFPQTGDKSGTWQGLKFHDSINTYWLKKGFGDEKELLKSTSLSK